MAIKKRSWFLEDVSTAVEKGWRFLKGDRPSAETFNNLMDSIPFVDEPEDRAKEDTGGSIKLLTGLVVASTDEQAKEGQEKLDDRTLAVQPSQLPTVDEDSQVSLKYTKLNNDSPYKKIEVEFEDKTIEISNTINTRNGYVLKWTTAIVDFFNGLADSLDNVLDKLISHKGLIDSNAAEISKLKGSVGGNFDQLLPVGSKTHHVNPAFVTDDVWKPCNGLYEVDKWATPGDQNSGDSAIYAMLKDIYALENGATSDLFKLPDMSNAMAYQEFDGTDYNLGKVAGKWGVDITINNLPKHTHLDTFSITGSGSHDHGIQTAEPATWDGSGTVSRGNDKFKSSVSTNGTLGKGNGSHSHSLSGSITSGGGVSSPNTATFNPPRILGGWLIKIK